MEILLTQTVQKGGCAAKVPALVLREILAGVKFPGRSPQVLIDGNTFDDAAVYQVNEQLALVQTLDFFTPIVDSPGIFGAVATANALSDVYAMGARPTTALAILAYPLSVFEPSVIAAVLQGACTVLERAGCALVGGHSIDDDTLKFGLSVTGQLHPGHIWSNSGAQVGDLLILTKALGTGTLCAGLKRQVYKEADIPGALASMQALNNVVDIISDDEFKAVHAATDITGFGLSGHSMQMARASGKTLQLSFSAVPLLPKVMESLHANHITRAHRTNAEYTENFMELTALDQWQRNIIHDPQTSGGLLLSVDKKSAMKILEKILPVFPRASLIGEVSAPAGLDVRFT